MKREKTYNIWKVSVIKTVLNICALQMIQIDIVSKSHYWDSTMGVQYIFCPRALFRRNVKQDFCVQEPAEYSEMGCFIFSSHSAEI